ncbi:MAG: Crp/Fnr family transcriptional regulator [Betaproteobacteria bacterium]|nr:Crp/Fnr family transcriptional regulator [Betaproteobacteria bacterium]
MNYHHSNTLQREPRLIEGVIGNLPMFRHLSGPLIARLAAESRSQHAPRGALICRRGESLPGLYAVAFGLVKLALHGSDGSERVVRLVGPGETFGNATALLGRPSSFDGSAIEDCLLAIIPPGAVLDIVEGDGGFARSLVLRLCESTLGFLAEVEANAHSHAIQRVASYLDRSVEPINGSGTWLVRLPVTKTVMASRLGIKKETLSRLLRELSERGLIAVDGREIVVHDRPGLAAIARAGNGARSARTTDH